MRSIINLNCIGPNRRWCIHWNVTRIQLEIAERRACMQPVDVTRELGFDKAGKLSIAGVP
jgi:hypothetical protein